MISPTFVTQALADDPAALKTLRAAITQSAQLAISGALQRWGAARQMSQGPTAAELEKVVTDKLFEEKGKLLGDWAEKPSIGTFDEYIALVADHSIMVLLATRGHTPAAKHLWQAFYNAAKSAIGGVLGDRVVYRYQDANELQKDLLLEAYEKLWKDNQRGFLGWRPAVGSFAAYIATVAANHAHDRCRPRKGRKHPDEPDDALIDEPSKLESPAERSIRLDLVAKTLQRMRASLTTQDEHNMFHLIVELGLPIKEIVKRTGKSPNAVSQRRQEFAKLAEEIRKKLDSDSKPSSRTTSGKKK